MAWSKHSHKKRKDSLETRVDCWYFRLNLKYLGWPYREYIKTAKNGGIWAALATFYCYHYGANASEAVLKIPKDQKDYHKCSSCVTVCWIVKIYQSITVKVGYQLTRTPPAIKRSNRRCNTWSNNWLMVSFIHNGNEITTWMEYSFKIKSTKSKAKQHF